ncbi:hypothetical protein [Deinococcus roseus]|uniref:Uncharacterized protein n=1 Tax=Deinococcus roseus TaxID=392414 RepID=A0ABQ2D265_9DEIO|nr:hypothetical protein [Deinococcus roseus]GGJ36361.1 hypothetical protein GCM10008938_23050 [Deinococcus roseus]
MRQLKHATALTFLVMATSLAGAQFEDPLHNNLSRFRQVCQINVQVTRDDSDDPSTTKLLTEKATAELTTYGILLPATCNDDDLRLRITIDFKNLPDYGNQVHLFKNTFEAWTQSYKNLESFSIYTDTFVDVRRSHADALELTGLWVNMVMDRFVFDWRKSHPG